LVPVLRRTFLPRSAGTFWDYPPLATQAILTVAEESPAGPISDLMEERGKGLSAPARALGAGRLLREREPVLPEFGIFLGLILGALGWALHTFLIVSAWLNGGPSWNAQGAYNRLREGPLEIAILFGVTLFALFISLVYFRRSLGRGNACVGDCGSETSRTTVDWSPQRSSRKDLAPRLPGLTAGVWSSEGGGKGYGMRLLPPRPDSGPRARAPAATP
jgi:hypothetical protein